MTPRPLNPRMTAAQIDAALTARDASPLPQDDLERLCQQCESNHADADFLAIQRRPELVAAMREWTETHGLAAVSLGSYGRDSATRALVALFAAGITPAQLSTAIQASKNDSYISSIKAKSQGGKRISLSALTPEVVRHLLPARGSLSQEEYDQLQRSIVAAKAAMARLEAADAKKKEEKV